MFEKKERTGLTVYLHYNRDARKLSQFGDIVYHSKRLRYLILYVEQKSVEELLARLKKERFVKKVLPSYIKELDHDFVGSLWREEEKNIVL
ncbi:TPA: YlbG family protein [Streptococcus suis]